MEAVVGGEISIYGSGFGTLTSTVLVNLTFAGGDGPDGYPSFWSDTEVRVKIPSSAVSGYFRIFYTNNLGVTNHLTSPSILTILSSSGTPIWGDYDSWKRSTGFTNDADRPGNDGLTMVDRYFHGLVNNLTSPASRPFSFSTTNLLFASGQLRPVLKFSRSRQAADIDFWIERSTNLASGAWQNVDADVQVTTNPANTNLEDLTITDFSQNSGSKAFYRLGLSTNTNL